MVWLKIDDQIAHHPKFVAAGPLASWLWVCGNGYCNKYLTDGFIPAGVLATLGSVPQATKWAHRLVEVGLWEAATGGFRVHDFHDHNPTAADVKAKRTQDRHRKVSTRIPPGIQTESGANPARVQSPRPVPSVPDPERGTPAVPHGAQNSGALAGQLPRDHLRHAVCGRVCLQEQQFEQFVRKLGGATADAVVAIRRWAASVLAEWDEPPKISQSIQGNTFQWWDARWLEFQGKPEAHSWRPSGAAAVWECPHTPRCAHRAACAIVALRPEK